MLLPLKAKISKKPRKKDGKSIISYQYCFSSEHRVNLETGIAVPAKFWNAKRQCISESLPEEFGEVVTLNQTLLSQRKVIETLIAKGKKEKALNMSLYVKERYRPETTIEEAESKTTPNLIIKSDSDFFVQIDKFITSKEKDVSEGTIDIVRCMKSHLLSYQEKRNIQLAFSMIDYNFYCDFVDFLTYEYQLKRKLTPIYGLKTNSVGRTIKKLVWFLKDRIRRKIIAPIDLVDFKVPTEEIDAVYLTYAEVGKVYHTDLTQHPELEKDRDLFVFGCLCGMRYSDYSTLLASDFRDGLLYKKMDKVDDWVAIPLREPGTAIFQKYFVDTSTSFSFTLFNRNIKTICALAGINDKVTFKCKRGNKDISETRPKSAWVTSHTCRRSFASNEFLRGTDVSLIMRITGHKSLKEFLKYIKVSPEEGARRIAAVWQARDNMSVFELQKTA